MVSAIYLAMLLDVTVKVAKMILAGRKRQNMRDSRPKPKKKFFKKRRRR